MARAGIRRRGLFSMATDNELIVDFDRPADVSRLSAFMRSCKGKNRVTVKRLRARRTNPQNRMYWGLVVASLVKYLAEQGESYTAEEVHHIFGAKFLRVSVIDRRTGEVVGETIRSTTKLSIEEFSSFIEQCVAWLADMFDIVCPMPGELSCI